MARNSFQEAAEKAGVPVGEFKLWLVEHSKASPVRWSKWSSGEEPVPEHYVIAFLRAKLDELRTPG